jgi:hypothetical protein
MTAMTRPFAVGAFTFVVETTHDDDRQLVESMFGDLDGPGPDGREPARFLLERRAAGWTIQGPRVGTASLPAIPLDAALKQLLTAVNLCALDSEPEHLHLHAAAATRGGRAVVLAAARDTGKTTTVAHLVARGWGFVTDETVRLSTTTSTVTGFPKPLSIKPGARARLAELERWMLPSASTDDEYTFLPIGATGATVVDGAEPGLLVLLLRSGDDRERNLPEVQWLHPADSVVALMQETLDAERFGAATTRLAQLASGVHTVALTMGTPEQTVDEIERLFAIDRPAALDVTVLPISDAWSRGVTSVAVGERVVIHDGSTGRIYALDEGGTRVWRRLGGGASGEGADDAVSAQFVAQLRVLGLLAGSR